MDAACRRSGASISASGCPEPAARAKSVRGTILGLLAFTLILSCSSDTSQDVQAIGTLLAKEVEAINAKDLQGLSQVWSQKPGILLFDVPPPGRYQGWDRIARSFTEFFERFSELQLTINAVQVEVAGNFGYATYDWAMTGKMGEYDLADHGQATAIYRKEDGTWKLVHAHFSPVPAAVAVQGGSEPASDDPGEDPESEPSIPSAPSPAGSDDAEEPSGPRSAAVTGQEAPTA